LGRFQVSKCSNYSKFGTFLIEITLDDNLIFNGPWLESQAIKADVVAVWVCLLQVLQHCLALMDQHAKTTVIVLILLVVLNVVVQVLDPDSHHGSYFL